jgi:hypothetical protein
MSMTMQSQSETPLAARPNRAADARMRGRLCRLLALQVPLAADPSLALKPGSEAWRSIDRELMVAIA